MREWRHRRSVIPMKGGCIVRDELAFVPRWRWTGPVLAWVYRQAFVWRHRALRRLFGHAVIFHPQITPIPPIRKETKKSNREP